MLFSGSFQIMKSNASAVTVFFIISVIADWIEVEFHIDRV